MIMSYLLVGIFIMKMVLTTVEMMMFSLKDEMIVVISLRYVHYIDIIKVVKSNDF